MTSYLGNSGGIGAALGNTINRGITNVADFLRGNSENTNTPDISDRDNYLIDAFVNDYQFDPTKNTYNRFDQKNLMFGEKDNLSQRDVAAEIADSYKQLYPDSVNNLNTNSFLPDLGDMSLEDIGTAAKGVQGLMGAYTGFKGLGLAKQLASQQRALQNANLEAATKAYNFGVQDYFTRSQPHLAQAERERLVKENSLAKRTV